MIKLGLYSGCNVPSSSQELSQMSDTSTSPAVGDRATGPRRPAAFTVSPTRSLRTPRMSRFMRDSCVLKHARGIRHFCCFQAHTHTLSFLVSVTPGKRSTFQEPLWLLGSRESRQNETSLTQVSTLGSFPFLFRIYVFSMCAEVDASSCGMTSAATTYSFTLCVCVFVPVVLLLLGMCSSC